MEYNLLLKMHDRIDEYEKQGLLSNRFIVIFGSNEPAERIMEYLQQKNITVDGLIDNNVKKDGTLLNGIKVTTPEKLMCPKKENALVFIASKYYPEMVVQLAGMGYEEEKHIMKAVEYSSHSTHKLTLEEFEKRWEIIEKGQQVYERIKMTRPNAQKIFVCPLIVLGDAYVGMSCMNAYMKKHNITDYALILVNRACSKIARLFGFDSYVVEVTREEMDCFLQFSVFSNMADGEILVLNHRHPYTCRIGEIGNYKGINFMDHFRYTIFGLDEGAKPQIPGATRNNEESKRYVDNLFAGNGLIKNKTAILLPYAKTAAKLPDAFWEKLVSNLKEQGYVVCTNSGGDGETAIAGSKSLFFDIRYALETVEAAGLVIGLRSGLCDVLSTAKTKKMIIYPDRFYGPDSFLHFFSLNGMELCDDAVELLWTGDEEQLMDEIMREIG